MASSNAEIVNQLDQQRKSVDTESYDLILRQLLDMVADETIDIAPDYQRHFVWDEERQSGLIESIFLSIPIPPLFFAENKNGTLEVIDGVQRISTLMHFMGSTKLLKKIGRNAPLRLKGLEKLDTFNGKTFDELPQSVRNKLLLRSLRITSLNDKSDTNVRYALFERLNTGGVSLHPQEIRNCVFRGKINGLLRELMQAPDYRAVVKVAENKQVDAILEEYVLRYFAYLERYKDFEQSVEGFLNEYMRDRLDDTPQKRALEAFHHTFSFLKRELPEGIVGRKKVTPVNIFEGISVGAGLVFMRRKTPKRGVALRLLNDDEFKKFTSVGTNTRRMVVGRIEYARDKFMP
jgi:hypothetical protein